MAPIILPVPHFQQQNRADCLAACALMGLTYLGQPVAYEHLVKLLNVRPEIGAPASNICFLVKLGVQVRYQSGTLDQLRSYLERDLPCIAFVDTGELPYWRQQTAHAVVVVGVTAQSIYLNDPALPNAPVRVPRGDFDLAWLEHDEQYAVVMPGK